MDVRDSTQQAAKEAFLRSDKKNTIIAATGSGKSKIALDIIRELNPERILLLTNATNLRDINWKNEFEKFGMMEYWAKTISATYQALYDKKSIITWDLIILDEIDFACTPQYSKCFNIPATSVLGLTGFITEDKREFLEDFFPICYEITAQQMQEGNLLNKSEFIFVEFPLSKERTIEQKTKKGQIFKVSENDQYQYWDKKFQQAMIVKNGLYRKYRLMSVEPEGQADYTKADWNFKFMATKRKNILTNLHSSTYVVYNILNKVREVQGNKTIIFSTTQKQCDRFPNSYHEKSQLVTPDDLNEGRVDVLSVVKKITRGMNLVGVNYLIRESYDGSEEIFHQSLGRLLRLRPDQTAKYIILIPYYEALARCPDGVFRKQIFPTQAANWVTKMMQSVKDVSPRYIKLDNTYQIKEGIEL